MLDIRTKISEKDFINEHLENQIFLIFIMATDRLYNALKKQRQAF